MQASLKSTPLKININFFPGFIRAFRGLSTTDPGQPGIDLRY